MSIEFEAAEALRQIALDETLKTYILQHPPLYKVLRHAAMRFIGGESLAECVVTTKHLNERGHDVTIDFMGESTRDGLIAEQATREFLNVISTIEAENLDASVSLDLSHIGMAIDPDLGYKNAGILAQAAKEVELEIMISMEGTNRTALILEIYQRLCEQFDNVGITLQAYLYRTPDDLDAILQRPGKIRLVKGAYEAPSTLALPRGTKLDDIYHQLMKTLLKSDRLCSIATHDESLLNHAHQFIQDENLSSDKIEFEMLKGVTPERLETMQQYGYRTRVYLPYGQEWHLYLSNRLAEHPPNIYQAIVDSAKHWYRV